MEKTKREFKSLEEVQETYFPRYVRSRRQQWPATPVDRWGAKEALERLIMHQPSKAGNPKT